MQENQVKIKFYFPETASIFKDGHDLSDSIFEKMRNDGSITYSGYADEKKFEEDFKQTLGNAMPLEKVALSAHEEAELKEDIMRAIKKCHEMLPHPDLPIFIFVYPWMGDTHDQIVFGGSTALSAYYTIHLFIDLNSFTNASLEQTIAHEWNHLVFFRYHTEQDYTLKSYMCMEGLAEIFREEIMGGEPAPWSLACPKNDVDNQLQLLAKELDMTGIDIYKEVFWNGKKYKRWLGYSLGYWRAKKFKEDHPGLAWPELIKTDPEKIISNK